MYDVDRLPPLARDPDRELAVEAEYQSMLLRPLGCWIDEAPTMRLVDVCCDMLPLGAEARRITARIDLENIIRTIALNRINAIGNSR